MKKVLQKLSLRLEDGFGKSIKDKFLGFINLHPEIFCLSLLVIACLVFLFIGLNAYPLMDVDETRYAVMSRDLVNSFDLNSLMLNGVPFLEKPPLYFWIVGASIKFFNVFSPFAVRFPIALLASFLVFFTYYVGKKVISRKFGVLSALVLLSSMFFLLLSHVAIIDMVLTVFMTSAIYSAFLSHFCQERYKKYCWWYFYIFIGLGFLAKGLLALAIPLAIVFIYNLLTKTAKEIFKPVYLIPGAILLLVMITPWHVLMYKEYGYQFIKEYFLIHHFGRFMGSQYIGRERPLLYFVPVFLLGFMPWTFIFLAFVGDLYKKLVARYKATEGKIKDKLCALVEANNNEQKLLLFATVFFAVVFFVFSTASTKLPTYILPLFPAAALLVGYYWWRSDEKGENEAAIAISTEIIAVVFILAAMSASIVFYLLPYELQCKLIGFKEMTIISLYVLAIFMMLRLSTKRALSIFSGYIVSMIFIITLSVSQIFNFVYATGQNEIVKYSSLSTRYNNSSQLVTFDFSVKPSALIEYNSKINFITDPDFKALDKLLMYDAGPTFVIVKNKNFIDDDNYRKELDKRLKLVEFGEKYSLYTKDVKIKIKDKYRGKMLMDFEA